MLWQGEYLRRVDCRYSLFGIHLYPDLEHLSMDCKPAMAPADGAAPDAPVAGRVTRRFPELPQEHRQGVNCSGL